MSDIVAPNYREFCHLLAQARHFKLSGHWSGSSFNHHPCGVIRRNILFVNHWNVNDYCHAYVHTMNPVKFKPWANYPAAHGDPIPHPEQGDQLCVYDGRWLAEGPWQLAIVEVLDELRDEIAEAQAALKAEQESSRAAALAAQDARIKAAAEAFTGGA